MKRKLFLFSFWNLTFPITVQYSTGAGVIALVTETKRPVPDIQCNLKLGDLGIKSNINFKFASIHLYRKSIDNRKN
jgi:hypothetical protein